MISVQVCVVSRTPLEYIIFMDSFIQKRKLPLLVILLLPFFAGAVYAGWNYVPNTSNLAALTEAQVQSILGVLSSFGVDQTLLKNVENSLRGETVSPAATSTETTPPQENAAVVPAVSETVPVSSVHISVSEDFKAGNAPAGTILVPVASFVFDATASSEDVSFSKLTFLYTDNALYDPYNCTVSSGAEEFMGRYKYFFNPDWVHPAGTGDKEFVLTTSLVVPKGEKKAVDIKCYTNSNAFKGTGSFSWGLSGVEGKATFTGVGADSKEVIVPTVEPSIGNTMTFTS